MDRKAIFRNLGKTQAVINFANDLERILFLDEMSLIFLKNSYAQDTTPQHKFLNDIYKSCNELLTTLQPLKRDASSPQYCKDLPTAKLIQTSLWFINREKKIERDAHLNSDAGTKSFRLDEDVIKNLDEIIKRLADRNELRHDKKISDELDRDEFIPEDYPNAVIESIEELRDAVIRAADRTKPKLGRKTYRTTTYLRKDKLSREFVESYFIHFHSLPPTYIDSDAYNVFVAFLHAANLSNLKGSDAHCYRNAIQNSKGRRIQKPTATVNV